MERQYTGRDHIASVFGGERTDRIPVRTLQSFIPILGRAGITAKEVRTQPERFVKAMATLYDILPQDGITVLVGDIGLFAELFGLSFDQLKTHGLQVFSDKSSFKKVELPDPKRFERLLYYQEICHLADAALPEVTIDAMSASPWSLAMGIRGTENLILDTKDDPQFVHELLRFATEVSKLIGAGLMDKEIGYLTIADPNAGTSVISPKMFRQWVKPYLGETIDHLKRHSEKPICLHICGYTDPIMEDLVSLGVDAISMDGPASLKKMVEVSQGREVIEGNIPSELYVEGTKEEIPEKVKESIDIAAEPNGYKYILCSGCQIPDNAPLENIDHFLEVGRQYGRYRKAS